MWQSICGKSNVLQNHENSLSIKHACNHQIGANQYVASICCINMWHQYAAKNDRVRATATKSIFINTSPAAPAPSAGAVERNKWVERWIMFLWRQQRHGQSWLCSNGESWNIRRGESWFVIEGESLPWWWSAILLRKKPSRFAIKSHEIWWFWPILIIFDRFWSFLLDFDRTFFFINIL